jgi:hypothetical protein
VVMALVCAEMIFNVVYITKGFGTDNGWTKRGKIFNWRRYMVAEQGLNGLYTIMKSLLRRHYGSIPLSLLYFPTFNS